jgi:hypothetical protein
MNLSGLPNYPEIKYAIFDRHPNPNGAEHLFSISEYKYCAETS